MDEPRPSPAQSIVGLFDLVAKHEAIRAECIPLVPTENLLSPLARSVLASDLHNRYYLTDSGIWEYPQTDWLASITALAARAFSSLYRAPYVNLRPLSGLNCMTAVLAGFTRLGDAIFTLAPKDGGHGATKSVAERLGLRVVYLPIDAKTQTIDIAQFAALQATHAPTLVYIDHSNVILPLELDDLVTIADPGLRIYYDCSHLLGLMIDPEYFDPRRSGVTLIGGSLHKTFPGPQKAGLFTADPKVADTLEHVTNTFVSSHHLNSVAAAAVSACEMLEFGVAYSRQLQTNARALGRALQSEGLDVQTVGSLVTATHQVWVNAPGGPELASAAVRALVEAGIVVNCARIPTLCGAMGLRLGATEVTRLGMRETEMVAVARLVGDCLLRRRQPSRISSDVVGLRRAFKSAQFCFATMDEVVAHGDG